MVRHIWAESDKEKEVVETTLEDIVKKVATYVGNKIKPEMPEGGEKDQKEEKKGDKENKENKGDKENKENKENKEDKEV